MSWVDLLDGLRWESIVSRPPFTAGQVLNLPAAVAARFDQPCDVGANPAGLPFTPSDQTSDTSPEFGRFLRPSESQIVPPRQQIRSQRDTDPTWVDADQSEPAPLVLVQGGGRRPSISELADNGASQPLSAHKALAALNATLTVTTLTDESFDGGSLAAETADGSGLSLREAIGLANTQAGDDQIGFAIGLAGGTILLTQGELTISSNINVDGDLDDDLRPNITIDGQKLSRVIEIAAGSGGIDGLKITNGTASGVGVGAYGGGIYVSFGAELRLTSSVVSGNSANAAGGGLYNYGYTEIWNTEISNNSAYYTGGGIGNAGYIYIYDSTLYQNNANFGGGFLNYGFSSLVNTTIANNDAFDSYSFYGAGGGIFNAGAASMTNNM